MSQEQSMKLLHSLLAVSHGGMIGNDDIFLHFDVANILFV